LSQGKGDQSFGLTGIQGRPNVVVDEEFKEHVEANTSVTVRQLSQELSISPATAWRHLKGLNKVKKIGEMDTTRTG